MAKTATRVDTQVKGGTLTLGGAVSGYFAGASNVAGIIDLKDAADATQITIDAGQAGSGNYQISTTGDVHIGGNLVIDGQEIVYDEVTIQSSAVITDNLTAGNAYIDSHKFQGSVLFDIDTTNDIIVRDSTGAGAALFETQNSASGSTFSVQPSSGNVRVGGNLTVVGDIYAATGATYLGNAVTLGDNTGPVTLTFDAPAADGRLVFSGTEFNTNKSLGVSGDLTLGKNLTDAVTLTFDSSGAEDEVITYTGSTDTVDSTARNYSWGDGATGDVSFAFNATNGPAVFKWDNATTGFDFDKKVKINGDLWVTGNIIGPGNPVAGLAQYAVVGTTGSVSSNIWTLATSDSGLGNGLQDEAGLTYPVYLGPQGNWSGNEHLIPLTVYQNGLALIYGATEDYTLSKSGGAVRVTFNDVPSVGYRLRAVFSRQA
jgi:hypothetical protein